MAAFIYFGEMLVASLLAVVLLAISPFRASSNAALFAAGGVAWTLAEYVVHRFVLHGLVPTQHALHHANPDAAVLNIFWQIWTCFEAQRSDPNVKTLKLLSYSLLCIFHFRLKRRIS
jgi:surface polysaccharide O-acyltransferase-like enzyme